MSISGDCTLHLEKEGREIRAVCPSFQGWLPSWYRMGDYCWGCGISHVPGEIRLLARNTAIHLIRDDVLVLKKKNCVLIVAVVKSGFFVTSPKTGAREEETLIFSAAIIGGPWLLSHCRVPCAVCLCLCSVVKIVDCGHGRTPRPGQRRLELLAISPSPWNWSETLHHPEPCSCPFIAKGVASSHELRPGFSSNHRMAGSPWAFSKRLL